ncbi:MAG: hypothetical protein IJV70_02515 [Clostridia bacterium]|nr:hypothetical protein [Clostridia bacterium]
MDDKNVLSGNGAANAKPEESKPAEKPKLVKLPVEESLFEFDGFDFEEVKRSDKADTAKKTEGMTDLTEEISKKQEDQGLESELKSDAELIARLSEVHGIAPKNGKAEEKEEEKEEANVSDEAVVTADPEVENEVKSEPEAKVDETEKEASIAPETEKTVENAEPALDSSLPSVSPEEKTHMAEQIAASFTGEKNESAGSGQVTFLDIINGGDGEDSAPAESSAEVKAEAKDASSGSPEDGSPDGGDEGAAPENEAVKEQKDLPEDIWDEEDRERLRAKKRYLDYCRSLTVPPLRIIKETVSEKEKEKAFASKPKGSGYRYEKVERLPIFPDGIHGGNDTAGYHERERAYCAERAEKKAAELRNKSRSYYSRSIFAAVLMITVLIFENINLFMGDAPDKLLTMDNVYLFACIEIGLIFFGAMLIFDAVFDGIKCVFKGVFTPESISAGVVLSALAYHISLMAYAPLPESALLLGAPAMLAILLTALYRYNMINREITAFGVASSYGEYTTEAKMQSFENSPEGRSFKGMASANTSLYKINKVTRIDGCYTASPIKDECFGILRKLAIAVMCISAVVGVVFGLLKSDVCYGILSAYLIITLASPVSVFVSMYYPRIRSAKAASEAGAAIIGFDDESDEMDETVIMADDGDIFPSDKLKVVEFVVCQTPDMERQLSRLCGLFRAMGGPVEHVFANMKGLTPCGEIQFTEIEERGIAALIDGKFLVAGCESYLAKYGAEAERYDGPMAPNGRAMYVAENGEFIARIIMEFEADDEMCEKISEHRHTDTLFSLKSCNPCIDTELVFDTTGIEPDLLRLVKFNAGDDVMPAKTDREGILVSGTGLKGLLTALLEYKRQKRLVLAGSKFAVVSCVIGGAAGLALAFVGASLGYMSIAATAVTGVLAVAAALTASRSAINTQSKKKKD